MGSRYYTFVYTLSYVMEACAEAEIPVVVLDRPNPLGGVRVEGPVLDPERYVVRVAELTNQFVEFDGLPQELAQRRNIVADAEKRRSDAAHALLTAAQETLFATIDGPRTSLNPVSPRRRLNTMLGILLGLVTGVGMAFLARQFSYVVRSETDLGDIGQGMIVVSVPRVKRPLHKAG